jgi:hypothetical protein
MSNDHVQVDITLENFGTPRVGYGMPMIPSHTATWPERIRFYNDISGVSDDWASDTPEHISAQAFFAQDPTPPTIAIGRCDSDVTQQYTISAAQIANAKKYPINVSGTGFVDAQALYTSSGAATAAEIHNGLVTQLNLVAGKTFTAAFAASVIAPFTFTADHTTSSGATFTHAAHGLTLGEGAFRGTNSGGGLPAGFPAVTDLFAIPLTADTFKLATSLANALAGTAIVLTGDGTGTQTLTANAAVKPSAPFTVTANAVNAWFSLEIVGLALFSIAQTHATPTGLDTDLADILNEDQSWYEIHTNFNSKAYVLDVSAFAEANELIYVFDTCDTDVINTSWVDGVTTDVGSEGKTLGATGTMGAYHPSPKFMLAAGWMGRWLPTDPGQANTKFKTLVDVPTVKLTGTQKTNLRARRMNTYTLEFGRGITWEGTVFSAVYRYLDVRRNIDWVKSTMAGNLFGVLAGSDIVTYDANGLVKVEGSIRGTLKQSITQGVFADGTTALQMPDIEDVPVQDKTDRVLRLAKWSGTLAGAINAIIPVKGTISF